MARPALGRGYAFENKAFILSRKKGREFGMFPAIYLCEW
jgi:hypothetical protein